MPTGISGLYYNTRGAREHKRRERFDEINISEMTFSQIWEDGYQIGFKDGVECARDNKEDSGK